VVGRNASRDAKRIDQFEDKEARESTTKIGCTNKQTVRAGSESIPRQKEDLRG